MKNPVDLIELGKDLIGLPTPVWHYLGDEGERPIYWNGYDYVPDKDAYREHDPKEGLQLVDAVGSGCFIVRVSKLADEGLRFARTYNADGTVDKGCDLVFCERWRRAGHNIWCHYDYPCRHHQQLELMEVVQAIKGLTNGN